MRACRTLPLIAILVSVAAPVAAQQGYGPRGFLRTGYSDKALGKDVWQVHGSSHDSNASIGVALYRAAEIASANGIAEIRVVDQHVRSQTMSDRQSGAIRSYHEATTLTFRAVRSDEDRTACQMREATHCLTLPVAGLLATYGPSFGRPAALPGAAIAQPLAIRTNSPYSRAIDTLLRRHGLPHAVTPTTAGAMVPAKAGAVEAASSARAVSLPAPSAKEDAYERYQRNLRAAQPVKGDSMLGWRTVD